MSTSAIDDSVIDKITDSPFNDDGSTTTIVIFIPPPPIIVFLLKWTLRLTCLAVFFVAPWANYQLIKFFQQRPYYNQSSAKWYIILKAVYDIVYVIISTPIIFSLTFGIDIVHRNAFTCKFITYIHYLSDDLISIMIALLCIDRMLRITCSYRFRTRCSLTICIIFLVILSLVNVHHLVRLQHESGFCHKVPLTIFSSEFDIFYSCLFTSIVWSFIFLTLVNLLVAIHYYRANKKKIDDKKVKVQPKKQEQTSKPTDDYGDRLGLIENSDDWEDSTVVTIEQSVVNDKNREEQEKQDRVDVQIASTTVVASMLFLVCNLPNFIVFVMRFVYQTRFGMLGYASVYIAYFPLLTAHAFSYFLFNHFAARFFPVDRF